MAWCVGRNTSFTTTKDPVEFNTVIINEGEVQPWQESNNKVRITKAGYYFIHIGAGILPNRQLDISVHRDNTVQMGLTYSSTRFNGYSTTSRSGILQLSVRDDLKVKSGSYGAFSDDGLQTIFIGFLLY